MGLDKLPYTLNKSWTKGFRAGAAEERRKIIEMLTRKQKSFKSGEYGEGYRRTLLHVQQLIEQRSQQPDTNVSLSQQEKP